MTLSDYSSTSWKQRNSTTNSLHYPCIIKIPCITLILHMNHKNTMDTKWKKYLMLTNIELLYQLIKLTIKHAYMTNLTSNLIKSIWKQMRGQLSSSNCCPISIWPFSSTLAALTSGRDITVLTSI